MAASDSLGGQFDRRPAQIPAHHADLIRGTIEHLGNKGIELVPGGMHITPEGGGKSRFVPHRGVSENSLSIYSSGSYTLRQDLPNEGVGVGPSFTVQHDPIDGLIVDQDLVYNKKSNLMSTAREEFDKPIELHDRSEDHPLTHGDRSVTAFGGTPRAHISGTISNWDPSSINSLETLEMLPHIGGNPKDPAKQYTINLDPSSNLGSEDLEALQGLRNTWSHIYNKKAGPRPVSPAHEVPRGGNKMSDKSPFGNLQRGEVRVHVYEPGEYGKRPSSYAYHPSTGNIRPYQHEA